MSIQILLDRLKNVQDQLIIFLDDECKVEENFQNLINFFSDFKILDDQHMLNLIIHLLLKISNNYHRSNIFFNKIDRIFLFFKDSNIISQILKFLIFSRITKEFFFFLLKKKY